MSSKIFLYFRVLFKSGQIKYVEFIGRRPVFILFIAAYRQHVRRKHIPHRPIVPNIYKTVREADPPVTVGPRVFTELDLGSD